MNLAGSELGYLGIGIIIISLGVMIWAAARFTMALILPSPLPTRLQRSRASTHPTDHELDLIRIGEERGRQAVLNEVRMLEHGQLKPHVLAVQRCLVQAQLADTADERAWWVSEGVRQVRHLLDIVETLYQSVSMSALPSDFEQTIADIAQSLVVAYPHIASHVEVLGQKPDQIPESIQQTATMVLYNALSNAYRHANPTTVSVQLQYAPDAVILVVRDDGIGIDSAIVSAITQPTARTERGSIALAHRGLRDMHDVVERLAGTLRIFSAPGYGTEIRVILPYHPPQHQRYATAEAA